MGYPRGPLLRALAARILSNLDHVERHASSDGSPYSDTQLLISLLGVIVFSHHRASEALGRLLKEHGQLGRVLTIRHRQAINPGGRIELAGPDGEPVMVDPSSIADLPRLLRNGIAHFNMLPLDRDGRFSGIRVWNVDDRRIVTLVADLDFDAFRPLARTILKELADPSRDDLDLPDPEDPLNTISQAPPQEARVRKPPILVDTVWNDLLDACGGDRDMALAEVSRTLRKRASDLRTGS